MDLERLKEKRKILRTSFTKHLTKIEFTLSKEISAKFNKEAKLEELLSLKSQLTEKLNELIKAVENIQLQIKISEMAADISSCKYKDRDELFDINDLVEFLRKEVECREASLMLANPKSSNTREYLFKNKTGQSYQHRSNYLNTENTDFARIKYSTAALAMHVDSYQYKRESNSKFVPWRNFHTSSANRFVNNQSCIFCPQNHMSHDCSLSTFEKIKALMAKEKCFICFQNHIKKFCNNNYQKCKICGYFSHNTLNCENRQRATGGVFSDTCDGVQSPSEERGDSRDIATTSLVSLSTKEKKNNVSSSVLLQTFSALVNTKPKGIVQLRCMLDGGANKSFILREVIELLDLKVVDKEALVIYTFGSEAAEKCTYDIDEITLRNVQTNKHIKIQAVVIDSITSARNRIPSFIRNIALERGIELADNSTSERIDFLIGSDYISEILGERNIRNSKRLIAVDSIFGYLIQGKEDEVNCKDIIANHLIVENEEFGFDRVRNLWSLKTIGINPDNEVSLSDKQILKSFEQNMVYTNKRYETRLLWKEDSRELESNYEIAKRRLLGLSETFENNKKLYL
ncbi:DUF1758 domain-containing protein [Trichonephila clavipes]|nr:DUF1758 domain-containing protein [Trichonephila clavipes]